MQILTMVQHMVRTESSVYDFLRLAQTLGVHLRADICTSGDVGVIHAMCVHVSIGNQGDMMRITLRIAHPVVIVKSSDTIGHAVNRPVVTDVQAVKSSGLNRRELFSCDSVPEEVPPVHAVVISSASIFGQHCYWTVVDPGF